MYLKSIEMSGFKSFADKTVLVFEPGMTCIVGPNGCGKSNISDAVRWVLGEQSAKALRGAKMEDCIFNGSDERKPLGMAEVAITFADCEQALGTEYHEVTVTRRVFRSGEGHYFINKTPCRLKDIQRLFMDTGVGTASYSLMEQGRIDQILSSRPEDRRTIFEEASGITKFKSDKKEAMRKLEHTEANLLRLSDVIREVKRQIGSLQRQAGKARRYKTLSEELRKLDIFTTKQRLGALDADMRRLEADAGSLGGKIANNVREIEELDQGNAILRKSLITTEHEIGTILEQSVQAQSRLDHTHEMIAMNRQRIEEYRSWSDRGSREIGETEEQLEKKRHELQELTARMEAARIEHREAESVLTANAKEHEEAHRRVESLRERIRQLRDESVETESLLSRLQNQLVELESNQRTSAVRRERLAAEKAQLSREVEAYEKRKTGMAEILRSLAGNVEAQDACFSALVSELDHGQTNLREAERKHADLNARLAATEARIDLLSQNKASWTRSAGRSLLLDESNPLEVDRDGIMGALTSLIEVEAEFRTAVEASLRSSLDAVLVKESALGRSILRAIEERREGTARLVAMDRLPETAAAPEGHRLIDHVRFDDTVRPVIEHLMGRTLVAESLDAIPDPVTPGTCHVTRTGCIVAGSGRMEFWMATPGETSPITLDGLLSDAGGEQSMTRDQLAACARRVAEAQSEADRLGKAIHEARRALDSQMRALAQKEGESQVIEKEAQEARNRLDTVSWELSEIESQDGSGDSERQRITQEMERLRDQRERIASQSAEGAVDLHEAESELSSCQARLTEQRILTATLRQNETNTADRREAAGLRIGELETMAQDRSRDLLSYEDKITGLQEAISFSEAQLSSFEENVRAFHDKVAGLRKNREKQGEELEKLERHLSQRRTSLDELRSAKSAVDVQCAEARMRHQNQLERLVSEYSLTAEQIAREPDPEWEDGEQPSLDTSETMVAELRTKMEAMGPVNLVAIEEYKELEERCSFLTAQEEDLVNSKQQLLDMIKKINRTTSEMFRTAFDQVNANFLTMYRSLFNGGSAKLVLVNEEDVLDCGIEIIARPPGKRLQNISLLSGGERTLTAVALLFAIYMIKPSPFCLLDELDAALDDSNIDRFVKILQGFLEQSQFVVITHNRQTIAAGRTLYGVTMPSRGVSKIVSMRFQDFREDRIPSQVEA